MSARSEREAADLEAISYMGHSRALCATMIARGYPPAVVDACLAAYLSLIKGGRR